MMKAPFGKTLPIQTILLATDDPSPAGKR